MNKYLMLNILFLNTVMIFGCVSKEPTENKVDMEKKAEIYFEGFKYEYKVRAKKDVNELSSIYISKEELSLNQFSTIENRITNDDWIFVRNNNGFMRYCSGKHNMLVFLYPIPNKVHINEYGSSLKITNYNNWIISYNYSESGIRECGG